MTDGIIQEVFKKYSFCDEDIDTANKLMQELIAKIKQEYPECGKICKHNDWVCRNWQLQRKLIGDNQE